MPLRGPQASRAWRALEFSSWTKGLTPSPALWCSRHVILPKEIAKSVPKGKILSEMEWRSLGVQQSRGWEHYACHRFGGWLFRTCRPIHTRLPAGFCPLLRPHWDACPQWRFPHLAVCVVRARNLCRVLLLTAGPSRTSCCFVAPWARTQ